MIVNVSVSTRYESALPDSVFHKLVKSSSFIFYTKTVDFIMKLDSSCQSELISGFQQGYLFSLVGDSAIQNTYQPFSTFPPQLPQQSSSYSDNVFDISAQNDPKSSQSCPVTMSPPTKTHGGRQREDHPPTYLSQDEHRHWAKERQKKDNHNQSQFQSLYHSPLT